MNDGKTARFYDDLAEVYHLIYADWQASVARQGEALAKVLRSHWESCHRVLDAACGIGTQAIGLATQGFDLVASDISAAAVARAQREAFALGLDDISFHTADLRDLATLRKAGFDAVLACDNALPHLLSEDQIVRGLRSMRSRLRPGGGCVISARDYAEIEPSGSRMVPYGSRATTEGRVHIFQIWDFRSDRSYDLSMFFVWERDEGPETRVFRSRYSTVSLERLEHLMRIAGFVQIERLDEVFFQPILIGTNPTAPE